MTGLGIAGPFLIPIVAIVGVFAYLVVRSMHRTRIRELEIRERIAMIEKGLVPPPEVDPQGFDRAMNRFDRVQRSGGAGRHRRMGITLIGVGIGLTILIGFSGSPSEGFGVGGFVTVLGIAFVVNSFFESRSEPPNGSTPSGPAATGTDQPAQPE